jgi:hypothetical protein
LVLTGAGDKAVTITFHDLSQSDAIILAKKLLDYVAYTQGHDVEAGAQ